MFALQFSEPIVSSCKPRNSFSIPKPYYHNPSSSSFPIPKKSNPNPRFRHCIAPSIKALDAAQSYDYEARLTREIERKEKLKIAIVGFGNYGQFLAKTLVQQGHTVFAHSRSDYSSIARKLGVSFFTDADDLCEQHPEVILLCTSIISTESVLRSLPLQRLKRSTLFVDVLSVKEFPKRLFLQILPPEFDILCAHPMFGPESGKSGWTNLPFVYEKTRIGQDDYRTRRCERFLNIFSKEGCRMVEMSCEEHDRHAAESQFITHTVGRVLGKLKLQATPINTKGYETLLQLVDNTCGDSFDLYYGLFMYNVNATEQLERLEMAFDSLKKELYGSMHDILRRQIFDGEVGRVDEFLNLDDASSKRKEKIETKRLPENRTLAQSRDMHEVSP